MSCQFTKFLTSPRGPNSKCSGSFSNVLYPSLWVNFKFLSFLVDQIQLFCTSLWTKFNCSVLPCGPNSPVLSFLVDQIQLFCPSLWTRFGYFVTEYTRSSGYPSCTSGSRFSSNCFVLAELHQSLLTLLWLFCARQTAPQSHDSSSNWFVLAKLHRSLPTLLWLLCARQSAPQSPDSSSDWFVLVRLHQSLLTLLCLFCACQIAPQSPDSSLIGLCSPNCTKVSRLFFDCSVLAKLHLSLPTLL